MKMFQFKSNYNLTPKAEITPRSIFITGGGGYFFGINHV